MELKHLFRGFGKRLFFYVFVFLGAASGAAVAQDLFWTDQARIRSASIDGTNADVVFDGSGEVGLIVDVAVTDDYIYWTDNRESTAVGEGGVWRLARAGGEAELYIPNDGSFWALQFLEIDESANKIYFTDYREGLFSADLDDGGNITNIADIVSNGHTGIALIDSNEAFLITAATGDVDLYRVNLSTGAYTTEHTFFGHNEQQYGLVYDPVDEMVYITNFGDGFLDALHLPTGAETELASELSQPLGLRLSPSRTHLVFAERGSGNISAYDLDADELFVAAPVGTAHFGVAVLADPQAPEPPPPAELPIVETFENGTPGESIASQPTSDGNATWREMALGPNATINYGGETGSMTYEPFTDEGAANVRLEVDSDDLEEYTILFDDVLLRGGRGDVDGAHALGTRLTIGARKTDSSDLGAYRIGQWHDIVNDGEDYQFRYGIHYVTPDGQTEIEPGNWIAQTVPLAEVDGGDYSGSELLRTGLELRVRGDEQRLYMDDSPLGPWYPTQASFNDGEPDIPLVINTDASEHEVTFMNPIIHGFSIEGPPEIPDPPPAIAGWQKIDDFDTRSLGNIDGEDGWFST